MKRRTFKIGTIILAVLAGYFLLLSALLMASANIATTGQASPRLSRHGVPKQAVRPNHLNRIAIRRLPTRTVKRPVPSTDGCYAIPDCTTPQTPNDLWDQLSSRSVTLPMVDADRTELMVGRDQIPTSFYAFAANTLTAAPRPSVIENTTASNQSQVSPQQAPVILNPLVEPVSDLPTTLIDLGTYQSVSRALDDNHSNDLSRSTALSTEDPSERSAPILIPEPPSACLFSACLLLVLRGASQRRRRRKPSLLTGAL